MNVPWYDDEHQIEKLIEFTGLHGLNEVAKARREAGYERDERLNEMVFIGHFWGDTCGNFGKILWPKAVTGIPFPRVLGAQAWEVFLAAYGLTMPAVSLSFDLPPASSACDRCGGAWTINNCAQAIVVHTNEDLPLEPFIGRTLEKVEEYLRIKRRTTVFFQPDLAIYNEAYRGKEKHPVFPMTAKLRKDGWVREPIKSAYRVQPGDVGHLNTWYYRHPACQQAYLAGLEREHFYEIFKKAGFQEVALSEVANEYCSDPTCCPPWFLVQTEHGKFRIGWRKRVISLELMDENLKRKCNLELLFQHENVTKGPDYIHCWGTEKAVEYLKTLRAIDVAYP